MGTFLTALCGECGFEEPFILGAGMADFREKCLVPALDRKSGRFVVANYFSKEKLKHELVFYNDPALYDGRIGSEGINWGDIVLKETRNKCPQCGHYSLSFIPMGKFD